MKMTIFLLFSACLTVSAGGLAQKVTLSANNVKLERIFKEIKKQTGYVFFYDARVMEGAKPLSIRVKNETVEDVLKECLQGQPLDFSIQRKTVTVFQKQLTSFKKQPLNQLEYVDVKDTFSIKGTITNVDDNTPIENVSIINRESGVGTQTNKNGRFTLRVTIGDILVISHVNFAGINYEVENNDDVFVKLAPKATEDLGEVVIVGYGQQKKTSVVSSISTVSGEDLDFSGRNLST
ncbi:MAG: secretin and TonB N-terminal domain-containing protein, partial [Ginsengibacter sp.]